MLLLLCAFRTLGIEHVIKLFPCFGLTYMTMCQFTLRFHCKAAPRSAVGPAELAQGTGKYNFDRCPQVFGENAQVTLLEA